MGRTQITITQLSKVRDSQDDGKSDVKQLSTFSIDVAMVWQDIHKLPKGFKHSLGGVLWKRASNQVVLSHSS